jgi:hypothetical protein
VPVIRQVPRAQFDRMFEVCYPLWDYTDPCSHGNKITFQPESGKIKSIRACEKCFVLMSNMIAPMRFISKEDYAIFLDHKVSCPYELPRNWREGFQPKCVLEVVGLPEHKSIRGCDRCVSWWIYLMSSAATKKIEQQSKEIAHLTNLVKELIAEKDKRDLATMVIDRNSHIIYFLFH